jgi:hypothetical protein
MAAKLNEALTDALESVKAGGLIRKYSLVWASRSEAPQIVVWKAADVSDDALRHMLAESLAGLASDSQFTIEDD